MGGARDSGCFEGADEDALLSAWERESLQAELVGSLSRDVNWCCRPVAGVALLLPRCDEVDSWGLADAP